MDLDSYDLISERTFEEDYASLCEGEPHLYGIDARFRVYRGDLTIAGDLELDQELQRGGHEHFGMVVEGNLTVEGVLYQEEYMVGGGFLFVLGDLRAHSLNKGAGAFFIQGDLVVEDVLFAMPEDEGYLEVRGSVSARQIMIFEGCSEWAPDLEVVRGEVIYSERLEVDLDYQDLEEVVHTTDRDALRARINRRLPLLKEGVKAR